MAVVPQLKPTSSSRAAVPSAPAGLCFHSILSSCLRGATGCVGHKDGRCFSGIVFHAHTPRLSHTAGVVCRGLFFFLMVPVSPIVSHTANRINLLHLHCETFIGPTKFLEFLDFFSCVSFPHSLPRVTNFSCLQNFTGKTHFKMP